MTLLALTSLALLVLLGCDSPRGSHMNDEDYRDRAPKDRTAPGPGRQIKPCFDLKGIDRDECLGL